MRNTLLILSLVLAFTTTNAQSDATWEETIDWINSKTKKGSEYMEGDSYFKLSYDGNFKKYSTKGIFQCKGNIYDTKMISVNRGGRGAWWVNPFFNYAIDYFDDNGERKGSFKFVMIECKDERILDRLKEAFEHLLVHIEQRKAKGIGIQKSNEKF